MVTEKETVALKTLAEVYLGLNDSDLDKAVQVKELTEIKYEKINS